MSRARLGDVFGERELAPPTVVVNVGVVAPGPHQLASLALGAVVLAAGLALALQLAPRR